MVYSNVIKGVELRVMCNTFSDYPNSQSNLENDSTIRISKDEGSWVAPTNTPVFIARGIYYLVLTANEMRANKVDLYGTHQTYKNNVASIFTSKKNNDKIKNTILKFK